MPDKRKPLESLSFPDSELVLAIVAPVGTDLNLFQQTLQDRLRQFRYEANIIRLSDLLKTLKLSTTLDETKEASRLESFMNAGNEAREQAGRGDYLALAAAHEISNTRDGGKARPRTAHILRSLKHPQEVTALRRIYGAGFFLIGVCASEDDRISYLVDDLAVPRTEAERLLARDEDEGRIFGQRTRDTFQMADVFVPLNEKEPLWRFLDLVFGNPFETPTRDEYAMFLAFGASLRSADLSRQVGAVVMNAEGEVVATGANDVPRFGGGLYWPGPDDQRDHVRGSDANAERRDALVLDVTKRLSDKTEGKQDNVLIETGKKLLKEPTRSRLLDITEFGRAVHAEMEALLCCARVGVSPRSGTLYGTTFPCHNCAKHIVAAGIGRVVYLEPYPKSQAKELHDDTVELSDSGTSHSSSSGTKKKKVVFVPFEGVGPRRFFDLFSVGLSSGYETVRKEAGETKKASWDRSSANMRIPMFPTSYLEREKLAAREIATETKGDQA